MTTFEEFEKLATETGDPRLIELAAIAKEYMVGLNRIFDDRDVQLTVLKDIDLPLFLDSLQEKGIFDRHKNMQGKLLVMNIFFIARHLWEYTGKDGRTKTGNDLHKVWPLMFEEDTQLSPRDVLTALDY